MLSSFYIALTEILYKEFGTDTIFDSNEAIKALRSGSDCLSKSPIANIRYYLTTMRKMGLLMAVSQGTKDCASLYLNQLNKMMIESDPQLSRLLDSVDKTNRNTRTSKPKGEFLPDAKYFIDELMFDTIEDAVEYCKKNIIKLKRKKIIWE
ncbi:hypothetical protein RY668_000251 [Shigella flexneri]|nr:hypothetical protein [Escherichia coli]ELN1043544.1 hypothetical protein [Shigella flexneri]